MAVLSGFLSFHTFSGTVALAADIAVSRYSVLSQSMLERAEAEVSRIRALVVQGTLPRAKLDEAEANLADVRDQVTLSETLYGGVKVQDLTPEQAAEMLAAAGRRVDRETEIVEKYTQFVKDGILARAELESCSAELESRKQVLELTHNRVRLLDELHNMAEAEQRLEQTAQSQAAAKNVILRFNGNGIFNLSELPTIRSEFVRKFRHPLPISALGQTLVHQSMGLDHRNRVDVALNPDQPEGVWLRGLLERLDIPYMGFRNAIAGAATAPHIHIGPGSTRLVLAER